MDTPGLQQLEQRVFFANLGPTITALTVNPNPASRGATITLIAAASDPDGAVTRVEFFRDVNANRAFDAGIDVLVGTDTSSRKGWRLAVSTASLAAGKHRFFARAFDNNGASSKFAGVVATLQSKLNLVGAYSGTISGDVVDLLNLTVTQQGRGFFRGTFRQVGEGLNFSFEGTILKNNRISLTYAGEGGTGTATGRISADGRTLTGSFRTRSPEGEIFTGTFSVRRI